MLTNLLPESAYEKPTPTGWSKKRTFAKLFQEYGLNFVSFSETTEHGPDGISYPAIFAITFINIWAYLAPWIDQ